MINASIEYGGTLLEFQFPPTGKHAYNGKADRTDVFSTGGVRQTVLRAEYTLFEVKVENVLDNGADLEAWQDFLPFAQQGNSFTYNPNRDDPTAAVQVFMVETEAKLVYVSPGCYSFAATFQKDTDADISGASGGHTHLAATGSITVGSSRPLAAWTHGIIWSNFQVRNPLPSDAVITSIVPVLIASAVRDGAFSYYGYGRGTIHLSYSGVGGDATYSSPFPPSDNSFGMTSFTGASLGTATSVLTGMQVGIVLVASLSLDNMADVVTVAGVGFAVVYTSATATVDTLMPNPLTLPSGSGLTWAVPLSQSATANDAHGSASGTYY